MLQPLVKEDADMKEDPNCNQCLHYRQECQVARQRANELESEVYRLTDKVNTIRKLQEVCVVKGQ